MIVATSSAAKTAAALETSALWRVTNFRTL